MKLVAITQELLNNEVVRNSDFLLSICQAVLAIYPAQGAIPPWLGYLAEIDERYVGTCAFKSPPTENGVEIAYFTFPEFEGKGIASQMARELIIMAGSNGVPVRAQTLPETNASTRILEKLGFRKIGSVIHPDDGEVWEWIQQ